MISEKRKAQLKAWALAHPEKMKAACIKYRRLHPEKDREWRRTHIRKARQDPEYFRKRYASRAEELRTKAREKRRANIDKERAKERAHYAANADRKRLIAKNARDRHPGRHAAYISRRKKIDLAFKLLFSMRSRMNSALRKAKKSGRTMELIGCKPIELKNYLESLFKPGMNWQNHGLHGWHIDHKRPCASFDLTDPAQQRECFHWTNLQPLWAEENMRKGARIDLHVLTGRRDG